VRFIEIYSGVFVKNLIMFDIDGTLLNSVSVDHGAFVDAINDELGVEIDTSWSNIDPLLISDEGIVRSVCHHHDIDCSSVIGRIKDSFIACLAHRLQSISIAPVTGAQAFLDHLKRRGDCDLALATGAWRESALLKLGAAGLNVEGVPLASSNDAANRCDIMLNAQSRCGGPYARRVYFGDGPWDKLASASVGYEFVAIGSRVEHDQRFDDFSDYKAILTRLSL
jgi:beta-phosphoglucomutase-like phosphatase (HAD superfamily)